MKAYTNFTDKNGNQYSFSNYVDFASFWFNLSRKAAKNYFPKNFESLQKAASSSKEARAKINLAIF